MTNLILGVVLAGIALYGLITNEFALVITGTNIPVTAIVLIIGLGLIVYGVFGIRKERRISKLNTQYIAGQIPIDVYSREINHLLGVQKGGELIHRVMKTRDEMVKMRSKE